MTCVLLERLTILLPHDVPGPTRMIPEFGRHKDSLEACIILLEVTCSSCRMQAVTVGELRECTLNVK